MHPLVSIAIPTYKRPHFLREALKSVVSQTYSRIQIIVADNASGDEIEEIIRGFNDPRIGYCPISQTVDVVLNFNRCLDIAEGKYFMFLCDDDWISPNYVEGMIHLMENSSLTMAYGRGCVVDEVRNTVREFKTDETRFLSGVDFLMKWLSQKLSIATPVCMFVRTEDLKQIGGFPIFPSGDNVDNALMVALALRGSVGIENQCVYYYRDHSDNDWKKFSWEKRIQSIKAFMQFLREEPVSQHLKKLTTKEQKLIHLGIERMLADQYLSRLFSVHISQISKLAMLKAMFSFPISWSYLCILCGYLKNRILFC